jgi:hypothetical protein
MKATILLASGVFSALIGVAASGQAQSPPASDLYLSTKTAMGSPREVTARTRDVTPPAPRGDLRGDIASNVRARPDTERDDHSRHH